MAVSPRIAPRRDLKDRRATIIGAAVAAVLAAVLFAVALGHREAPPRATAPVAASTTVVVASKLIRRNTLLTPAAVARSLRTKSVANTAVAGGAVTSLDLAQGKMVSADIRPGEQLTTSALTKDNGAIAARLTGDERAVTLPIDKLHGMTGDVADGDRVDVYASFNLQTHDSDRPVPTVRLLAQNATLLRAPAEGDGKGDGPDAQVTLGVPSAIAQQLAFTADYGKVWIAARPASGASTLPPSIVTVDGVLYGKRPTVLATDGKIR